MDMTMDDKVMFISNEDKQNENYWLKRFDVVWNLLIIIQ